MSMREYILGLYKSPQTVNVDLRPQLNNMPRIDAVTNFQNGPALNLPSPVAPQRNMGRNIRQHKKAPPVGPAGKGGCKS